MKNILLFTLVFGIALISSCQYYDPSNIIPFQFQSNDNAINTAVTNALSNNPDLSGFKINVQATNGVVSLSGYVKTIRQSDLAGQLASNVRGVKSVHNNVIVRK